MQSAHGVIAAPKLNATFGVVVLVSLVTSLMYAQNAPFPIGVCRSGLAGADQATRERTLKNIHNGGMTWIRDVLRGGSPKDIADFVTIVKRAKELDLKVLVNVTQIDSDYDGDLPINKCGWKEKKFSRINLQKFQRRLKDLLNALKDEHLVIDAVEFGNEDDQYCYNPDIPNGHKATQAELVSAARAYGQFMKTGATVLHDSAYYPAAKILTFGMAHIQNPNLDHLDNPARFVAMLQNIDGVNYLDNEAYRVDGYGTHVYASPNDIAHDVNRVMQQDIQALGRNKPYWLTEWGFTHNRFPNDKGQSLGPAISDFIAIMDNIGRDTPLGPAFFYSYNGWLEDEHGNLLIDTRALSRK